MWVNLIYLFLVYSFLGWIIDSLYVSLAQKKFVNRGFLSGPFCPIYGFGALALVIFVFPYEHNLFLLFISSIFVTSVLEYLTSFFLEKLFHVTWWDYSKEPFNLHGRICLKNSLYWGVLAVFILTQIHPQIYRLSLYLEKLFGLYGIALILIYFSIDFFLTVKSLINLKFVLKQKIPFLRLNFQSKRLIKSFSDLHSKRYQDILDKIKKG